jgi:hypothetical protein
LLSITYVSQSLIDPQDRARALNDLMVDAISRNTDLDITGLLIVAPDHFAQLLEGPRLAIETVMTSIEADPRHTAVQIVQQSTIETARFRNWRMARFDQPNFGVIAICPLLMAAHKGNDLEAIDRLDQLIDQIATSRQDQQSPTGPTPSSPARMKIAACARDRPGIRES